MGKFKQSGGYDKVVRSRKYGNSIPKSDMKVTKQESMGGGGGGSKKVQFDMAPQGPTLSKQMDVEEDSKTARSNNGKRVKGIISSVQFKAPKKQENKSTFLKLKESTSKYSEIKQTLLKQINTAESSEVTTISEETARPDNSDLNFITKPKARLTNAVLKRILNSQNNTPADGSSSSKLPLKPIAKGKAPQLTDFVGTSRKINKKAKSTIKKNLWSQKIDLIKNQIKDKKATVKREQSVITGDLKPMLDSLLNKDDANLVDFPKKSGPDYDLFNLLAKKVDTIKKVVSDKQLDPKTTTKRERRDKNLENEKAKAIQKQSIRFKKSQDDISLFSQLLDYKEFTSNPLETLKKHLNA